jgi:peptidoglycan/xylan/chitin deacetylase (PgdA/CDA1 family)
VRPGWRGFLRKAKLAFIAFLLILFFVFLIFIYAQRSPVILMYHSIAPGAKSSISLSPDTFARQLEYLSKHGYRIVPLSSLVKLVKEGKVVPPEWVVLTFDDGFADFYKYAYPLIVKQSLPVTLFIYPYGLNQADKMSWEELNGLDPKLVEIGAHSLTHKSLIFLDQGQRKDEISSSRRILEDKLHRKIVFFSYPFGAADKSLIRLVGESGFAAAVGTAYPLGEFGSTDLYLLRRVFVSRFSEWPFVFRFMVSGYYIPVRQLFLRVLNLKVPRDQG